MSKIIIKHSSVADKVPLTGDLDAGEIAINTTDEKMYIKNNSGTIIDLNVNGADLGEFILASIPSASSNANKWALVTDASGGRTTVRSDGTNWKVVAVEGATIAGIISDLLIHSDTTNGSTTFVDSSLNNFTLTPTDAEHSTTVSKIGSTSIKFTDAVGGLSVPDNAAWDFSTNDFTMDFWLYLNVLETNDTLMNKDSAWWLHTTSTNKFGAFMRYSAAWQNQLVSTTTLATATWYHLAITRSGSTWRLFVDGTEEDSVTDSSAMSVGPSTPWIIGAASDNSLSINGYMDEIRVVNGTAVWTANFTPPTAPYSA